MDLLSMLHIDPLTMLIVLIVGGSIAGILISKLIPHTKWPHDTLQ